MTSIFLEDYILSPPRNKKEIRELMKKIIIFNREQSKIMSSLKEENKKLKEDNKKMHDWGEEGVDWEWYNSDRDSDDEPEEPTIIKTQ